MTENFFILMSDTKPQFQEAQRTPRWINVKQKHKQCCVSFCCITKWISYMYTYIPISPPSCISLPPSLSHPSRWSQSTELIYESASHWLSILHFVVYIHLFIFVFISITQGDGLKKIFLRFMSKSVLPVFSSKSFIVSRLTFRSLIHFEFIFVYGVRECSNFILLHVAVQFSQHHLLKRLSFLHCIFLPPLSKVRWPYVHGFISGLSSLFHWSIFLFLCQYNTVLITVAL